MVRCYFEFVHFLDSCSNARGQVAGAAPELDNFYPSQIYESQSLSSTGSLSTTSHLAAAVRAMHSLIQARVVLQQLLHQCCRLLASSRHVQKQQSFGVCAGSRLPGEHRVANRQITDLQLGIVVVALELHKTTLWLMLLGASLGASRSKHAGWVCLMLQRLCVYGHSLSLTQGHFLLNHVQSFGRLTLPVLGGLKDTRTADRSG